MNSEEKTISSMPNLTAGQKRVIKKVASFVKKKLLWEKSGHDWWHIYRVWNNSIYIAKKENADLYLVSLGALLHDIADWKFHKGDETVNTKTAKKVLEMAKAEYDTITKVVSIVDDVTFKGVLKKEKLNLIETQIVQDADRLDAIGATGIARAFTFGGYAKQDIHNHDIAPKKYRSFKEYKNKKSTTINHFYEKLLHLHKLMNTKTGKTIAAKRHKYMKQYVKIFLKEWYGEDKD